MLVMVCIEKIYNTVQGLRPMLLMVVVQMAVTRLNVFYKLAANDGMSLTVLVAYQMITKKLHVLVIFYKLAAMGTELLTCHLFSVH